MAVGGDNSLIYIRYILHKIFNLCAILLRGAVTCCIGNINHLGAGSNNLLYYLRKELILCTSSILRIELNLIHKAAGIFYAGHSPLHNLLSGGVEFILDMIIRCAYTCMNPLVFCKVERICSNIYILLHCP